MGPAVTASPLSHKKNSDFFSSRLTHIEAAEQRMTIFRMIATEIAELEARTAAAKTARNLVGGQSPSPPRERCSPRRAITTDRGRGTPATLSDAAA
jgi:hypothetical protein